MRQLIAAMNMTLDGFCNHDKMSADDEIHDHYTELLRGAGAVIYGRKTFELMEFWPTLLKNPSGNAAMDEFAVAIDEVHKIVYSRTLEKIEWKTAELKRELIKDEIVELKQQPGKPIFVGSPSMIVQLGNLGLIDEYQLGIHPTVVGSGLPLFKNINKRINLKLLRTKTFGCGAVIHYLEPTTNI
ncbi:MAG: dihydrofolate reductase family protein [Acidobacteria bacterium]|nr:dihydrofolate reductase family protein [Acidobacteriota bacterium]